MSPLSGNRGLVVPIRVEDHPTHPGGWDHMPYDSEYEPHTGEPYPPGYQMGSSFKSVRTTPDGREVWTWGRLDDETLAAGYVANTYPRARP